eukprot:tig00021348_g20558.t1
MDTLAIPQSAATLTATEQRRLERTVSSLYAELAQDPTLARALRLKRDETVKFLLKGLVNLPAGFVSLDASRPWLCYWILHALDLLDAVPRTSDQVSYVIDFLRRCQHPTGGFGGGPGQVPHLAPTFAAVNALLVIGTEAALASIDRAGLLRFLRSIKSADCSFRMHDDGETDVRGVYTAAAVYSLLGLDRADRWELFQGTDRWVASCQTFEGGLGGEPGNEAHGGYTFCGFAALRVMGREAAVDRARLLRWAAGRQMRLEGGFHGRTNKLVDSCYSYWQGALFPILHVEAAPETARRGAEAEEAEGEGEEQGGGWEEEEEEEAPRLARRARAERWRRPAAADGDAGDALFDQLALQGYVLACCQPESGGGLRDKPGKSPDFYHTCYALSGLSVAQHALRGPAGRPLVLGDPSNLLAETDALLNLRPERIAGAAAFFAAAPAL